MGILDIFGGGSAEDKARKLRAKVTQKYGNPSTRQKALQQLGELKSPEAVRSLMARFTVMVDPHTTDADEKEHTFKLITGFGQDAVEPVKEFLVRSDAASSWALRILRELLTGEQLVEVCLDGLKRVGNEYTRDPEKKVLMINTVSGKHEPRIAEVLLPFLEDPSDEVKIASVAALGASKQETAREPLLKLLTDPDTARRVKAAAVGALHESGLDVQGFRPKVEAELAEPYFLDGSGIIQKRG